MSNLSEKEILNKDVEENLIKENKFQLIAKFNNDSITIWLENDESIIIDVKKCIEMQTGLSVNKQILLFDGIILEDGKRLNDYQINNKSIINIVSKLRGGMKIFVKTLNKKIYSFLVDEFNKVSELKSEISKAIRIEYDLQQLFYNDQELDDEKALNDYGIISLATINIRNKIRLFVETSNENKFSISVNDIDKIIEVKHKIAKLIKIAPEEQKLFYHNLQLNDDEKRLMDYQISDKSDIIVVDTNTMKIIFHIKDGQKFPMIIRKADKVIDVKHKIERITKLNKYLQILIYGAKKMVNNKTIDEYQIPDGSEITILIQSRETSIDENLLEKYRSGSHLSDEEYIKLNDDDKYLVEYGKCDHSVINIELPNNIMQIFIKSLSDKTKFPIYAHKSDRIKNIQVEIERIKKLNFHKVILIYQGKILDDDNKTIDEYQICDGSVINISDDEIRDCVDKLESIDKRTLIKHAEGRIIQKPKKHENQICDQSLINNDLTDDIIQLFIKSSYKKICSINVHKLDNIKNFKLQIKNKRKFNNMMLTFQDKILHDNKTIDEYQISDGSVINIDNVQKRCHEYPIEIFFRITNKELFHFTINNMFTIGRIKNRIKEKTGLNKFEYELIDKHEKMRESNCSIEKLTNEELIDTTSINEESNLHDKHYQIFYDDEKYLSDYQICDQSVINIDLYPGVMLIYFKLANGKLFQTYVHKSNRIKDIKYKITREHHFNFNENILTYKCEVLNEDDKTIDDYQICDQSAINIVERFVLFKMKNKKLMFIDDVQQSDKIIDVKYKIQEKIGLHPDGQQLIYENEILEDDKMIGEYGIIRECSTIDVSINDGIEIIVQTIQGNTIEITVLKTQKIRDIQNAIQNENEIKVNAQILIYQDKILDKEKTFDEYCISNKSIIWAVEQKKELQVIVVIIEGFIIVFHLEKVKNIIEVKVATERKIGKNIGKYDLHYKNIILDENNKDLMKYKMDDEPVIFITAKPRMRIFVKTMVGGTILLKLKQYSKIKEIKFYIQEQIGLHPGEQKLFYRDKLLDDEKAIIDYEICENSVIHIIDNNEIQIFVTTSDGKTIALKMQKAEKIIDLKYTIYEKIKFIPSQQQLMYQGEMLKDDVSLNNYKIVNNSMINIINQMCGGMQENADGLERFEIEFSRGKNLKMGDIETQIAYQVRLDSQNQTLVFHRKVFDDNKLIFYFEIKNRQQVSIDENFRTFMKAIKLKRMEVVKSIFQHEYLRIQYGSNLYYPIHYACIYDGEKIIDFLIDNKCDLEVTDLENKTPIHYACIHGNIKKVQRLVDKNCNINAIDYLKRSPIHLACLHKQRDIVDLLLKNKCEIDIYDCLNQCPLNIANELNMNDMINLIDTRKVADSMKLSCINDCNHKFCFKSLLDGNFENGEKIGSGCSGQIYHCIESRTEKNFALKYITKNNVPDKRRIEYRINGFLLILQHENIVKYYGAFHKNEDLLIFMEYLQKYCSLKQTIEKTKAMCFNKVIDVTKKLLTVLNYLHGNKIIHRDIKPDNIMLDDKDNVKLIDFGESLELSNVEDQMSKSGGFCGTENYIAPEILDDGRYSYAMDIYSLGITIIEMGGGNRTNQKTRNLEYTIPDSWISYGFSDIIGQMLIEVESSRATASILLQHLDELYYSET